MIINDMWDFLNLKFIALDPNDLERIIFKNTSETLSYIKSHGYTQKIGNISLKHDNYEYIVIVNGNEFIKTDVRRASFRSVILYNNQFITLGEDKEQEAKHNIILDFVKEKIMDKNSFKIGDWVCYGSDTWQIHSMSTDKTFAYDKNDEWDALTEQLKLWQPQKGEWCIFHKKNTKTDYTIAQFSHLDEVSRYVTTNNETYNIIAPLEFIQTLKEK